MMQLTVSDVQGFTGARLNSDELWGECEEHGRTRLVRKGKKLECRSCLNDKARKQAGHRGDNSLRDIRWAVEDHTHIHDNDWWGDAA